MKQSECLAVLAIFARRPDRGGRRGRPTGVQTVVQKLNRTRVGNLNGGGVESTLVCLSVFLSVLSVLSVYCDLFVLQFFIYYSVLSCLRIVSVLSEGFWLCESPPSGRCGQLAPLALGRPASFVLGRQERRTRWSPESW